MAVFYPSTWATYNSFLNAYGVWPNSDLVDPTNQWITITYYVNIASADTYTLRCSGDNHVVVKINGETIGSNDDWSYYNDYTTSLSPGAITIDVLGLNDGDPAYGNPGSVAAALYTSAGTMIWNTRVNSVPPPPPPAVPITSPRTNGMYVKRSGVWTEVVNPTVNQSGSWNNVTKGFVKRDGVWKKFFPDSGSITFSSPGSYGWIVPPGVHSILIDAAAGGGGGGGSNEVEAGGGGGGGGSGGFTQGQALTVTPGETVQISVGNGGSGAPFVGRTYGAPGGSSGGDTVISGSHGSILLTGGGGGGGGYTNGGGSGGAPGGPTGNPGNPGSSNGGESDQYGGAGGSTPFGQGGQTPPLNNANGNPGQGPGAGGSGASAWNYHGPLNWSGGAGATGVVTINW